MKRKYTLGLIVIFSSIGIGILIGKTMVPKKRSDKQFVSLINSNHIHWIDPMIEVANQNHLSYQPIKSFENKIEQAIEPYKIGNPKLNVSYVFKDLNTETETVVNAKTLYAPASLMKIPVMVAVLKIAETKPSILQQQIQFVAKKYNLEEESGFPKVDGNYYSVEDLLVQSIAYSDNDATYMLRLFIGEQNISEAEDALGVHVNEGTSYKEDILDVESIVRLFTTLYESDYLGPVMSDKALSILAESSYQKGIRKVIPHSLMVAHKYGVRFGNNKVKGSVQNQLHQFGIVYFAGKPFLVGIMTKGADQKTLEEVIEKLTLVGYYEFINQLQNYRKPNQVHHYTAKMIGHKYHS